MRKGSLEGFFSGRQMGIYMICKHQVWKKWQVGTGHVIRAVLSSAQTRRMLASEVLNHNDTLQNVKNVERTIDSYMVQMK